MTDETLLPDDWTTVRLGDIGEALIGLTYDPSSVKRSGTLVLRSSNIQDEALALDDNVYVDSAVPERIRVQNGDILICVRNGSRRLIGKSTILDERVVGQTFGAFMTVFRSDANAYLRFFFQSDVFKQQIDEHLGATINQITNGSLKSFTVALPPKAERDAIVRQLVDVDDLLVALSRLIAKKRAIKDGMAQRLLTGKSRLAGFERKWTLRPLSDLLTYQQPTPYLVSSTDYAGSGTPVLTAGKTFLLGYTGDRHGIYDTVPAIIFDDFTTDSKFVSFPFKAKSSAMKILSAKPGTDLRFAFERMQLINFVAVDHKRRWISEYSKIEVEVPQEDEQTSIAAVLADCDSELFALRARLRKAQLVKQGIAQQLLSGRVRLPALEAVV